MAANRLAVNRIAASAPLSQDGSVSRYLSARILHIGTAPALRSDRRPRVVANRRRPLPTFLKVSNLNEV
jgi:hypothetical protein